MAQHAQGAGGAGPGGHRERGQGHVLPDEGEDAERHDEEERPPPAEIKAEEAAQRRCDGGGEGVAAVEDDQRPRDLVLRHQSHHRGGRHRPEAADDHPDQGAAGHEGEGVGREGDHEAGHDHQAGQPQQDAAPVQPRGDRRDEEAGQHGEEAGDGYGLAGLAFGDVQVGRDGGQQADRHELRRDQGRDAEGQRADGAPGPSGWSGDGGSGSGLDGHGLIKAGGRFGPRPQIAGAPRRHQPA